MTKAEATDLLALRQEFHDMNGVNGLIWYTSFMTGNFKPVMERQGFSWRPLLGFLRYGLVHLPFRPRKQAGAYDLVFATIFMDRGTGLQDSFFGSLPVMMRDSGLRVALAGKIANRFSASRDNLPLMSAGGDGPKQADQPPHYCPSHLLTKKDALLCVWQSLRGFLSLRYPDKGRGMLRQEMRRAFFSEVLIGLMIEKMLRKLLQKNPDLVIIHGFEGNTWETACSRVTSRSYGMQHGVILGEDRKMTAFRDRPLPRSIITTGPLPASILEGFAGFPAEKIRAGWTFRHAKIFNQEHRQHAPAQIKSVLVLMQGNEHKTGVMAILRQMRDAAPAFAIVLRPHPAVPLAIMGIGEAEGFVISTEPDIHRDILGHDACLYVGSTAALESIYLGVPVVRIAIDDAGPDPLEGCPHLRSEGKNSGEIIGKIEELASPSARTTYEAELPLARTYFESYFTKPDHATKEVVKSWINQSLAL